jgi:hypothetical protein
MGTKKTQFNTKRAKQNTKKTKPNNDNGSETNAEVTARKDFELNAACVDTRL